MKTYGYTSGDIGHSFPIYAPPRITAERLEEICKLVEAEAAEWRIEHERLFGTPWYKRTT